MKKSIITYGTILTMLASSCAPKLNSNASDNRGVQQNQANPGWVKFQELVNADNPNVPLAETLIVMLRDQNPELLSELHQKIESGEIQLDSEDYAQWDEAKKLFIVGPSSVSTNKTFLQNTLNLNLLEVTNSKSFNHQLGLKISGLIQSVVLQKIIKTYDNQIKVDASYLAANFISDINNLRPDLISKIDKTKSIRNHEQQIEQIILYLQQADQIFAKYKISDDGQFKLTMYTAVAATLVGILAQQPTVKTLIKEVIDTAKPIYEVSQKAKRVVELANSVKKNGTLFKDNARQLGNSILGFSKEMQSLKLSLDGLNKADAKAAKAIYSDVINGKIQGALDPSASENTKQFFTRARTLNENFSTFAHSAARAAESMDVMIGGAEEIAKILKIEFNPKLKKAINTARTVSKAVQAGQAILSAYTAGGFAGALAAFSGGPATLAVAAIGGGLGGGPDPAIMGELAEIKQTLNEIKELQLTILERQRETMEMIKDLALLMESYHRDEMQTLLDIRDDINFVKEGLSDISDEKFYACQSIVDFALRDKNENEQTMNTNNIEPIKKAIRERITSRESLLEVINYRTSENLTICNQLMSIAFVKNSSRFSRAVWAERNVNNVVVRDGADITKTYYIPAFKYLGKIHKGASWQEMALHLPVLDVSTLMNSKVHYIYRSGNGFSLDSISDLTATHKLEKFVSALLILHPLMAVKSESWNKSIEQVIQDATSDLTAKTTTFLLNESLTLVQKSIAQEAILAGEPLLPSLSLSWDKIMNEKCKKDGTENGEFCFVRENELMFANLLTYFMIQQLNEVNPYLRSAKYQALLQNKTLMAHALMLPESRIYNSQGELKLALTEIVKDENGKDLTKYVSFPSVKTVENGQLQYTEAMSRMVRLEHKIADELVKVSTVGVAKNKFNFAVGLFAE